MDAINKCTIKRDNDLLRVCLPDSIGIEESKALEKLIISHCLESKEKLIIDFTETTMLYSAGLGLLMRLHKHIKENNGTIYLINATKKLRDLLYGLNLNRVFRIYSTDTEFDISQEDVWKTKVKTSQNDDFVFDAQIKDEVCYLHLTGQLCSLFDLSSISEYVPCIGIRFYLCNLSKLDIVDTYGAQLFNDFIERIQDTGGKIVFYGINRVVQDLLQLYTAISNCEFFASEAEAMKHLH